MQFSNDLETTLIEQDDQKVKKQTSRIKGNSLNKFIGVKQMEEQGFKKPPEALVLNFCTANSLGSLNFSEKYKVYTCNTCKVIKINICKWCYYNCHKNHDKKLTVVNEVHSNQQYCACALSYHKVDLIEYEENFQRSSKALQNICHMNELFYRFEFNFYFFKDNYLDEYAVGDSLCLFCMNVCFSQNKENYNENFFDYFIEKSITSTDPYSPPKCKCKNYKCRTNNLVSTEKLLKEIITIPGNFSYLESKTQEGHSSLNFLIYNICRAFIQPDSIYFKNTEKFIHDFHKDLMSKDDFKQNVPLSPSYNQSLDVLNCLANHLEKLQLHVYIKNINDLVNFNFLIHLFQYEPIKNCSLLKVKLICTSMFRKFVLEAKPKLIRLRELISEENFSPLHGLVFYQNITYLEECIEVSSKVLINFIKTMTKHAIKYNGKFDDEKIYFDFILETIRWVKFIILFKINKEDYSTFTSIIQNLALIFNLIKDKTKYEQKLRKDLEEVTVYLIFYLNQNAFEDYLKNILLQENHIKKEKVITNREYFAYEKGEEKEKYEKIQNHQDIQKNIIKMFFGSDQKKVDVLSFKIENFSINSTIHTALFSNTDYFSQSLKAILESETDYINLSFF